MFSLKENKYASFPFSKLRDHCRKGCQMSVRARSSRWPQANTIFLTQQDSCTDELTELESIDKTSASVGQTKSHPGEESWGHRSIPFPGILYQPWLSMLEAISTTHIQSWTSDTTAHFYNLRNWVKGRGPLFIQSQSGGLQNKVQISWSYILRPYLKNGVHLCLRLYKLCFLSIFQAFPRRPLESLQLREYWHFHMYNINSVNTTHKKSRVHMLNIQ